MARTGQYLHDLLEHLSDNRNLCVRQLLDANFTAAQQIGLKIYERYPQYLLLSLYMDLPRSKPLLLHLLKKMPSIEPVFLQLMIRDERLSCSDLHGLAAAGPRSGFMSAVIERDWFLKSGRAPQSPQDNSSCCPAGLVSELLDKIDDFRLYQYALEHEIDIPVRDTANYKWYIVHRDGDREVAVRLMRRTTNFEDVLKLCQLAGITEIGNEDYDILIRFLLKGYSEELLKRAVALFLSLKSFLSCKILLALLIASRIESNLVLALYVSYSTGFAHNYEIELVHLFLNRYFCFHKNIHKLMRKMSIKNIQIYNNAYIWTDPMIVSGVSGQYLAPVSMLKSFYHRDIGSIETKLSSILDSGRVGHAISLLRLHSELKKVMCVEEAVGSKILASDGKTLYSGILGGPCDYLFDKLTAGHVRTEKSCLGSLFAHPNGTAQTSVLENPYIRIDCPKFLYEFADLTSFQIK